MCFANGETLLKPVETPSSGLARAEFSSICADLSTRSAPATPFRYGVSNAELFAVSQLRATRVHNPFILLVNRQDLDLQPVLGADRTIVGPKLQQQASSSSS
jgi:hypothetical protein